MNLPFADSNLVPGRNLDCTQPSDRPYQVGAVRRDDTRRVPGDDGLTGRCTYQMGDLGVILNCRG
jgi:hypothetical protein